MNLQRNNTNLDTPCCKPMEKMINGLCDESLSPLKKRFILFHIRWCPQCQRFFNSLSRLREKLHLAREEGPNADTIGRIRAKASLVEAQLNETQPEPNT